MLQYRESVLPSADGTKGSYEMSYAICRIQKIGGAKDIAGIQIHNRREREHSNSNPNIDRSRTHLNYSLINENETYSFNALVEKRIQEAYTGKRAIRKDAVRLCEVLFTSDKAFFDSITPEQQRQYFEDCYIYACNRFGKENIISAVVHLDEATPHLHLDFVPLTADGRLSAKAVIGERVGLQDLQDTFFSSVGQKYGLERGSRADLSDKTVQTAKHLTVIQYKQQQERETLEQLRKQVQTAKATVQKANEIVEVAKQRIVEAEQKAQKHESKKEKLKLEKKQLQAEVDSLKRQIEALQGRLLTAEEVNTIKPKKTLTGAIRGISYADIINLKKTAERIEYYADAEKGLKKREKEVEKKIAEAEKTLKLRLEEIDTLTAQVQSLIASVALAEKLTEEEKRKGLISREIIRKNTETIRRKQEQRQQALPQQPPKKRGK